MTKILLNIRIHILSNILPVYSNKYIEYKIKIFLTSLFLRYTLSSVNTLLYLTMHTKLNDLQDFQYCSTCIIIQFVRFYNLYSTIQLIYTNIKVIVDEQLL